MTISHSETAPLVVGIDLATQHARTVCCDARGVVKAEAVAALDQPASPHKGWIEQDATGWWPAVAAALRTMISKYERAGREVVAVTVCATSGTVVMVDDYGRPVSVALMYDDQRAQAEAGVALEAAPSTWDAIGLRIGPTSGLAKAAWLCADDDVRRQARRLMHASDVVVSALIDEAPPTDWSHALKTGYDVVAGEWPLEVMEALGVPPHLLPDVLPPTSVAGRVSAGAAAATGLPRNCEVRLGMSDGCASQIASGADAPGRFVSVLGTTLVFKGASHDPLKDPSGVVYNHRHPDGHWLPGGASNTGGRALTEMFDGRDLRALDDAAAARGPSGCICYPLMGTGERFPFAEPEASAFLLGDPVDEPDLYRAVLEGVAFLERISYAYLSTLGASIRTPVVTSGGGSRSTTWNRLRATVLGDSLEVADRGDTAFGACVLAASGGVVYPNVAAASQAMVAPGRQVEGVRAERQALQDNFSRFVDALSDRGWISDQIRDAALGK